MAGSIQKTSGAHGTAYLVRVEFPPDPVTGKRRQRSKSFKTKKEAERALAEWLVEIERGTVVDGTKMTTGAYLAYWLDAHGHNLRPATLQQYRSLVNAHLIPALGAVALMKLSPAHLTALYAEKRKSGRRDGRGGLSPRTVRHLHAVIREALDFAVRHQLVVRNVAEVIDAPRFDRKEMETWSPDEIQRFLTTTADHAYSPIWLLYITTGLRRGEGLGLRWRDVDLTTGRLNVAQSVVDVGGHACIQEPKTAAARRIVKLSPICLTALREHRTRQLARRLAASAWEEHDLIFTTEDGGPINPRNLARAFDLLQRKAGVQRIRIHDLRHTHATLLFNDGQNVKMISQRLGHSDVSITLSVYAHLAPDAQDIAAASIDGLIFRPEREVS